METILRIKEATFASDKDKYSTYDGWYIVTSKQTIKFGIDNRGQCCECFGNIISNDDITEFIGAELKEIKLVDTALNVKKLKEEYEYLMEGSCIFLNLETDKGTLQFTLYNEHNGYYGHDVIVESQQLDKLTSI